MLDNFIQITYHHQSPMILVYIFSIHKYIDPTLNFLFFNSTEISFYHRNFNRIGFSASRSCTQQTSSEEVKTSVTRNEKRVFVWKGILKKIISYSSYAFTDNPQPRRRGVRSQSVLFMLSSPCSHPGPSCSKAGQRLIRGSRSCVPKHFLG